GASPLCARVLRATDLAQPARTERRTDLVRTEARSWGDWHRTTTIHDTFDTHAPRSGSEESSAPLDRPLSTRGGPEPLPHEAGECFGGRALVPDGVARQRHD